ncbi:MAG: OmpH family outer membrane protein [Pseudomonadota bacterium]
MAPRCHYRRRRLLQGLGAALLVGTLWPGAVTAQTQPGIVLVVSRARVLQESRAAQILARRERELTQRMQAEIDAVKAELADEEETLARLRPSMDRDAFDARAEAFRQRVVTERRDVQRRSAALQQVFRDAREQLVDALGPILERIRVERGASVILNADAVLAAAPAADVTAEVLAAFDASVPVPQVTLPNDLQLGPETPDPSPDAGPGLQLGPGPAPAAGPNSVPGAGDGGAQGFGN